MSVISVYAIFANEEEAERIAQSVIEERLAACANLIGPVSSIYRWKGEIERAHEVAAIFKTTASQADELIARIAALHSYEVPCIAAWPVDTILGSYADWVEDSVICGL